MSNLNGRLKSVVRARPAAAAPVVGWPPVRSFRRNLGSSRQSPQSSSAQHQDGGGGAKGGGAGEGARKGGLFVKVNMDGVPIGRKVDLTAYGGYAELSAAVGKLFRGLLAGKFHIQERCMRLYLCSSSDHAKKKKILAIAQLRGTRPPPRWAGAAARGRRRPRSP